MDDKWVRLYLRDGAEVVRLSRLRNKTAQVYLDRSLADVARERIRNRVEGSSSCCYGSFGQERMDRYGDRRQPCALHTAEWLDAEVAEELAGYLLPEAWDALVVQQAAAAQQAGTDRVAALNSGAAEWRKRGDAWVIFAEGHQPGDIVRVRKKSGVTQDHRLGERVADDLYLPVALEVAA